ncbi:MAG: lysine--tRNA ligase, partial [Candidatus Nealsonbacteria bacterium CG08_land_8_20_14_0_20_43_11]
IDNLWKYCRKKISGPGFLVNQPVELSPLAKRSEKDQSQTQKFQVIMAGSEMGNGYSELNDPLDQAQRFKEQEKLRAQGDEEAQMNDKDFVEMLEYGMPPTCGFGLSERLFSFLCNKPARECQIFPLMRPKL